MIEAIAVMVMVVQVLVLVMGEEVVVEKVEDLPFSTEKKRGALLYPSLFLPIMQ